MKLMIHVLKKIHQDIIFPLLLINKIFQSGNGFLRETSWDYYKRPSLFPSKRYYYLALASIFVGLVYVYFGWKYFEYDSEGEVVVFLNRGVILSNFLNYRGNAIEIRRSRIVDYKVYNFLIYKRLIIYIESNNKSYSRHCNITFVSPRKINYLKQSLNKLIKKNKS